MALSESSNINGKTLAPGASAGVKVLSFGAGAIGMYIGGSLALAGHQVVFVEQPSVAEELRLRGMRLDLTLDERRKTKEASLLDPSAFVIVSSLEDALRYGPFDVALFALKSFDTLAALENLHLTDKMHDPLSIERRGQQSDRDRRIKSLRNGDIRDRSPRRG
jgi:2-dehydropantoate 2-reductase